MQLTTKQLRQLIKEELLNEEFPTAGGITRGPQIAPNDVIAIAAAHLLEATNNDFNSAVQALVAASK